MLQLITGFFRRKSSSAILEADAPKHHENNLTTTMVIKTEEHRPCWLIAEPGSNEAAEERWWKQVLHENEEWIAMLDKAFDTKPLWIETAILRARSTAKRNSLPGTREYEDIFRREYLYNCRSLAREMEEKDIISDQHVGN